MTLANGAVAGPKHIPQRTCVSCGKKADKRELLRIVASKDGSVRIDPTGKANGRGAYVCRGGDCSPRGPVRGRVQHALRLELEQQQWDELIRSIEGALSETG